MDAAFNTELALTGYFLSIPLWVLNRVALNIPTLCALAGVG